MSMPDHIPQGDYPKHAAMHVLDLEQDADRLLQRLPGHRRQTETLAREGGSSIVMMAMEAGDSVREHATPGPVSIQLLRGHARLTAAGEDIELREGQLALLQPGVPHDLRAEAQSVVLLTVSGAT